MGELKFTLLLAMGLYFSTMLAVSVGLHRGQSQSDFAIAGRNLGYFPVIGSLAASFRDGSGIVLWIGFGFTIGYGGMWVMFGALLGLLVYAWFGPRMRRLAIEHNAITVGELIRSAVGPVTEKTSTALVLVFSLVIIAIQLYIAGNLFAEIVELPPWLGMSAVALVVGLYLFLGGYSAVVKTDVVQFVLILAVILIPLTVDPDLSRFSDLSSTLAFPLIDRIALFLIGFFFVLSSADSWQKLFAARDDDVIRKGFPLSGVILIFMTLSLVWVGMTAKTLLPGDTESGRVLFELFKHDAVSAPLLAVIVMAITMSTLDTFCYLFSSSSGEKFPASTGTSQIHEVKPFDDVSGAGTGR